MKICYQSPPYYHVIKNDKWGISWQITPIVLSQAICDSDPAAAKRAFEAMMQMGKIDITKIEAALRGE